MTRVYEAAAVIVAVILSMILVAAPSSSDGEKRPKVNSGPSSFDVGLKESEQVREVDEIWLGDHESSPYVSYRTGMFCDRDASLIDFLGCGGAQRCGTNGMAFRTFGVLPDGSTRYLESYCDEPGDVTPGSPQLTMAMIAEAFRRVPLPASTISIQPPGGRTLVNLPTILSTDAAPFVETVTLLGQQIRLDITPTTYRWVHGDGSEQTTDWAGVEYAKRRPKSDYLTHTYLTADRAAPASVDTTWSARFSVNGGPWLPVPDTVTIEGEPVALEVVEASPILAGYG